MRDVLDALTPDEVRALGPYLIGETQQAIAEATGQPQQTLSDRIGRAVRKLERLGVPVVLPGRGRRPARTVTVDARSMDRMRHDDDGEIVHGRWVDGRKIDRDHANN